MTQFKQLDFSGFTIFCGADVHKGKWRVNIQYKEMELEDFSHDASTEFLYKHLQRKYRGATFRIGYEEAVDNSKKAIACLPAHENKMLTV